MEKEIGRREGWGLWRFVEEDGGGPRVISNGRGAEGGRSLGKGQVTSLRQHLGRLGSAPPELRGELRPAGGEGLA